MAKPNTVTTTTVAPAANLEAILALVQAQAAEIAALKASKPGTSAPSLKVTEKGACSVYGIGRFPVTLYKSQFKAIFALQSQIEALYPKMADKPAKA